MLTITELVDGARDHYLLQFTAFADKQRRECRRGAAEVKFQLQGQKRLFRNFCCVDFVRNDGGAEIVELQPDVLVFDPVMARLGDAQVAIEQLRWDDVVVYNDIGHLPTVKFEPWFDYWFDPEERRYDSSAATGNTIHSLLILQNAVHVDFGTATTTAFWELLDVLKEAGATQIRITDSRSEAGSPTLEE